MDMNALFHLEYGLFLLSARDEKDNGCIINTVMQVTANPVQICIAVNKSNYTHDIISKTKQFNISILTQNTPFSVFLDFGYVSGRNKDKFEGREDVVRSANGIYHLTQNANAFLSGKVVQTMDLGTHTLFIAQVTQAVSLSDEPSITYNDYQDHVKPKNPALKPTKKGFICEVCGYIYEGESLPEGYICPICKHGAEVFHPL